QVEDEQQDGRAGDGGQPGGVVEEPVQGVDVEQLGGEPTDSLVSKECDIRVAGPARQIAVGEISSRGLLPFTGPQCLNGAEPNKKTPVLHCPLYFQGAAAGIRSNIFTIRFFAQMRQDARKT